MKQEKAVLSPRSAMVKKVLKAADYKHSRKMVPVIEGELIMVLTDIPLTCVNPECQKHLTINNAQFCPHCGTVVEKKKK